MKTSINVLLWTAAATEEHLPLLDDLKSWGYDGVEFPMFSADCSPWKALAARLDDLGLGRTSCTISNEQANPISEDPALRRAGIDHIRACVDASAELGSTAVIGPIVAPCGLLVGRPPNATEWAWGVEGMREAAEYAASANITLALEALNRFETYFITSMAEASRFVDEVDHSNLRLMYDTFHANIEEKDPIAAIGVAGERIAHVHISENDRGTPGEGHIDFALVFSALKKVGYDGWLTVEAFGRALPEVAAATCIWRDMIVSPEACARAAGPFMREGWAAAV